MSLSTSGGERLHRTPGDLMKALTAHPAALTAWRDITPLARNEWVCWVISVKQTKTRTHHIERTVRELTEGKRRPCCWPGCQHRKPAVS